jgi:hypothetical protein
MTMRAFMCLPLVSIGARIVLVIGLSATKCHYAQKQLSFCAVFEVAL